MHMDSRVTQKNMTLCILNILCIVFAIAAVRACLKVLLGKPMHDDNNNYVKYFYNRTARSKQ